MSTPSIDAKATAKMERIREREMFRYFQPNGVSSRGNQPLLPTDTALTALAQLVALKLDCQSVLVNVISRTTQFTLTEGTRTIDVGESHRLPDAKNGLWVGCGGMDKESAICQHTVTLPLDPENDEFLIIPDLREDQRTKDFDYVQQYPCWRFYWGAPLITKAGISIGALCILDNRVRYTVTAEQKAFCRTMTSVIMEHLEILREVAERKKGTRMSKGLNAFVEGRTTMDVVEANEKLEFDTLLHRHQSPDPTTTPHSVISSPFTSPAALNSVTSSQTASSAAESEAEDEPHISQPRPTSRSKSSTSDDSLSECSTARGATPTANQSIEAERTKVFQRAATILRQSLDLKDHGGVVFLDTSVGFTAYEQDLKDLPTSPNGSLAKTLHTPPSPKGHDKNRINSTFEISRGPGKSERSAQMLGLSHDRSSEMDDPHVSSREYLKSLSEQTVQHLVIQYPKGHLWTFDELAGNLSSDSDRVNSLRDKPAKPGESRREVKMSVATQLQQAFIGVRQLIFIPQWDSHLDKYSTCCFCWTTSEQQIFSIETELSYLAAFSNCIVAELARLQSIHSNLQKTNFISSISHELRSPLHGILACAEFLAETTLDPFQSNLVDTINASGRTLHQTIEHVLDYSKINAFEDTLRKTRKSRTSRLKPPVNQRMPLVDYNTPTLNIYAIVDVAAVAEEVVQGTYAASEFDAYATTEMASATASARGRNAQRGLASGSTSIFTDGALSEGVKRVEVMLDIDPADYTFTTQQGALRRLIMNLLGNSLKYTEKGRIIVKLSLADDGPNLGTAKATKLLILRVIDTGKGISPEYLRTRLFTPFAQENALAPGTGLGLSIVKSITGMLGGSIEVRSQLGKGTEVKVALPMTTAENHMGVTKTPNDTPGSTPSSNRSTGTTQEDSISILKAQAYPESVAMHGFDVDDDAQEMRRVLAKYLTDWFGFSIVADLPNGPAPTIIMTDETNLTALLARGTEARDIVVFCTSSSRYHHNNSMSDATRSHYIEFCAKPFGPYRLAKILRTCLERDQQSRVVRTDESLRESLTESVCVVPMPELSNLSLQQMSGATSLLEPGTLVAASTENAHMVLGTSEGSTTAMESSENTGVDFPFPTQDSTEPISGEINDQDLVRRPNTPPDKSSQTSLDTGSKNFSESSPNTSILTPRNLNTVVQRPSLGHIDSRSSIRSRSSSNGFALGKMYSPRRKVSAASQKTSAKTGGEKSRQPRILVVDDNKINLLLLQTFMKKRKYSLVDSAENGHLAVKAAEKCEKGYDVIFMDISMPIMNGFEATRCIRQLEAVRCRSTASEEEQDTSTIAARLAALPYDIPTGLIPTLNNGSAPFIKPRPSPTYTPSLIIALTGLASQQDQSDAFSSGVDLFMTKPVSFKEVGKLLDNWEANSPEERWDESSDGGDEMGAGAEA